MEARTRLRLNRAGGIPISYSGPQSDLDMAKKSNFAPLRFMQEVRSEVSRVVWPTRRELLVTTAMVFAMAALAAVFFFLVDQVIRLGLSGILGMF